MGQGEKAEIPERGESRVVSLEAAVAERDTKIAEQQAQLAAQQAQLAEQQAQIALLTAQVAKLTEQLGRNSNNSHLPPSSDGPGSGAKGKPRGKSGRKRGGQKGHRGSHRELLPPECVDLFIDLFPPVCLCCGHPLPRVVDAAACRYQQLDLRDHRPHLTEWRRHEVVCERCGGSTRAEYDRTQIPELAFGPCLTAVVVLLTGAYHLSRRKTRKLLKELFGISISTGTISAMEKRASEALAEAHEEAKSEVQHAGVKHSDATSWLRSGKVTSLWVLATVAVTVYQIFDNGRRRAIVQKLNTVARSLMRMPCRGPNRGRIVSRQVCHAHLLRKFVAFSQRDGPDGAIGRELLECTRSERGDRFAERVMTVVRTARKQGLDVLDFLVRSITASIDNATAPTLLAASV